MASCLLCPRTRFRSSCARQVPRTRQGRPTRTARAPRPSNPVVAFLVEGIADLVAGLAERGVKFVVPQPASFQGTEGVIEGAIIDFGAVKSTWLRDSEDNILALNELVAP